MSYIGFCAIENCLNKEFIGWMSFRFVPEVGTQKKNYSSRDDWRSLKQALVGTGSRNGSNSNKKATRLRLRTEFCSTGAGYDRRGELRIHSCYAKFGYAFTNKFKYTQDELLGSETTHLYEPEIWDGFDVRYTVTKNEWQAHRVNKKNKKILGKSATDNLYVSYGIFRTFERILKHIH